MGSAEYLSVIILNRLAEKIPVKGAVPDQYVKDEVPEVSVTSRMEQYGNYFAVAQRKSPVPFCFLSFN
jgi:hypothetical protein